MWETWLQSLGQEDPLEKEMATHSSILAWRIPWMEEPGTLQSTGSQRVGHGWHYFQGSGTQLKTCITVCQNEWMSLYVNYKLFTKLWVCWVGFPGGSDGKESTFNAGDLGSILGLERSPGGGHGNPLQYSCLENLHGQRSLMGYNPWDPKSQTQLKTKEPCVTMSGCHCM